MLWGNGVLQEGRLYFWCRVVVFVKDFPIWGSGYGTFQYVEPLCRSDPANENIWTNAENDYLEALVEGGLVRLAVSVLAIGLVFWLGYRAVRRGEGHEASGLAMGALFGFTTMVVQSFVDFGIHIPAIALLATVLCAHLCAAGGTPSQTIEGRQQQAVARRDEQAEESSRLPERTFRAGEARTYSLRLWGPVAGLAGAMVSLLFGLLLAYEGWRGYRVQELRQADSRLSSVSDPASRSHQIDCLAAAARLAPESARLQVELALAHFDVYLEQRKKLWIQGTLTDAAQAVCDGTLVRCPMLVPHPALSAVPAWDLTSEARNEFRNVDERQLVRTHLVPALRCFLQARHLCPLLPESHRFIAENIDQLEKADARIAYLERVTLLVPYDAGLWYWCGQELLDKQPDQAWKNWRRCLELSDFHLSLILEQAAARLGPGEILDRVLPDDPKILLAAAMKLYPEPTAERQLFLDRALTLFENRSAPMRPEDLHAKALTQCALGRAEEALATYRAALALEPNQVSWRFEFARLLDQCRRFQEARRELLTVLLQQPQHTDARELLTIVEHEIAEGK